MEIIFLVISFVLAAVLVYLAGRCVHDHEELIRAYKESEYLAPYHIFLGLLMALYLMVILAACNNTFWHLPYYFYS